MVSDPNFNYKKKHVACYHHYESFNFIQNSNSICHFQVVLFITKFKPGGSWSLTKVYIQLYVQEVSFILCDKSVQKIGQNTHELFTNKQTIDIITLTFCVRLRYTRALQDTIIRATLSVQN